MSTRALRQGRKESPEEGLEPRGSEGAQGSRPSPSLVRCSTFTFALSFPVCTMALCRAGTIKPLASCDLSSSQSCSAAAPPPPCLPGAGGPFTDHLISSQGGRPRLPEGDSLHRLGWQKAGLAAAPPGHLLQAVQTDRAFLGLTSCPAREGSFWARRRGRGRGWGGLPPRPRQPPELVYRALGEGASGQTGRRLRQRGSAAAPPGRAGRATAALALCPRCPARGAQLAPTGAACAVVGLTRSRLSV